MIFETHVFCSYSHLWIYIAIHLQMAYLDWLQAPNGINSRCTWRWKLSQLWHTLWCIECVNLEAKVIYGWRYTWRRWSNKHRDGPGGHNEVSFEMNFQASIKQVWRCAWSSSSCEIGGRDQVSWGMHLEASIVRTWRPWSSKVANSRGGHKWTRLE